MKFGKQKALVQKPLKGFGLEDVHYVATYSVFIQG
jgi:hypothetical protein